MSKCNFNDTLSRVIKLDWFKKSVLAMVKAEMYFFYRLDDNETIFNTLLPRFYYMYIYGV